MTRPGARPGQPVGLVLRRAAAARGRRDERPARLHDRQALDRGRASRPTPAGSPTRTPTSRRWPDAHRRRAAPRAAAGRRRGRRRRGAAAPDLRPGAREPVQPARPRRLRRPAAARGRGCSTSSPAPARSGSRRCRAAPPPPSSSRPARPALALLRAQPRPTAASSDATRVSSATRRASGRNPGAPFDLVFLDPPYGRGLGERAIGRGAGRRLARAGRAGGLGGGRRDRPRPRLDPARRAPLWEHDDLDPPHAVRSRRDRRPPPARPRSSAFPTSAPARRRSSRRSRPGATCSRSCRPAAASRCCYQLPALTRPGVTLVISPLIALMRDQVRALQAAGVAAGALTSQNDRRGDRGDLRRARRRPAEAALHGPRAAGRAGDAPRCCAGSASRCSPSTRRIASASGATTSAPTTCASASCARALGGVQTVALTATADAETRAEIVTRLFGGARARDLPARLRPAEPAPRLPRPRTTRAGRSSTSSPRAAAGRASSTAPAAPRPRRWRRRSPRPATLALAYHAGMEPDDRRLRRDPLPARGRADRLRHDRLRHGRRQARHPLRRPRRPAEVDRGLLPGDRPRRARRRARPTR